MVIVAVPGVAVLLADSVSKLVDVVGFGLNEAVTPVDRPEAERATLLVAPVTVMVQVLLLPCTTGTGDPLPQDDESVKPARTTVSVMEVVAVSVPEVPVMVIG